MTDRRGDSRSLRGLINIPTGKALNDSAKSERDASMERIQNQRGWNTAHLRGNGNSGGSGKKR